MDPSLLEHRMSAARHGRLVERSAAAAAVFGADGDPPLTLVRSSSDGLWHHLWSPSGTEEVVCNASGANLDGAAVTAPLGVHLAEGPSGLCCCVEDSVADGSDRGTYLGVAEDAAVVLGHLDALDADPGPHRWVRWAELVRALRRVEGRVGARERLGCGAPPPHAVATVAGLVERARCVESTVVARWRAEADRPDALVWWAALAELGELHRRGHVELRWAGWLGYLEHVVGGGSPLDLDGGPAQLEATRVLGPEGPWGAHAAEVHRWHSELCRAAAGAHGRQVTALVREGGDSAPSTVLCTQFGLARHARFPLWVVRAPALAVSVCDDTYRLGGFVPTTDSARFVLEMLDTGFLPPPRIAEVLAMANTAFG